MMHWIIIAAVSMPVVCIAHQNGFIEKAYVICGDIARCPMCSTFWITLSVLILSGCLPLEAAAISFVAAYLSNWFGLLMWQLNKWYEALWERMNRK